MYTIALRTETPRSIRRVIATRRDLYSLAWVRQWYLDRGFLTPEEEHTLYHLDVLLSARRWVN